MYLFAKDVAKVLFLLFLLGLAVGFVALVWPLVKAFWIGVVLLALRILRRG